MPDKPQNAGASFFALPEHRVVSLTGRDAAAFAQAQCMNDVAALAPGHWQWNGWLTPKGRVIALFALLLLDTDSIWLLLHDAPADGFAQQLQRFVFRSKVSITVRDDLHVSGALAASTLASGAHFASPVDAVIELDISGGGGGRALRITTGLTAADSEALASWAVADLRHGLPRLPASQAQQWTPQQLSLDRLRAYSVKKGCYPGQEIVARTHFLGQAKRGLALFEADAPVTAGSELRDGNAVLGTVVSVAASAGKSIALVVAPFDNDITTATADGVRLTRAALFEGLAR